MPKRIAVVVAWVAATVATASITLAAVDQAGRQVSERPAVPVAAEDLASRVTAASTTSEPAPTTTTGPQPTTTVGSVPATSTTGAAPPPTSTTSTPPGTVTTATASTPATAAKVTPGGTVVVSLSGTSVGLVSAVPTQGFDVDVEETGPEKVEVRFEKRDETVEYRVRASLEDGELRWDVDVDHDD